MKTKYKLANAILLGTGLASLNASADIEEIVVTAQKRAENSQDVPIAIQAFSGAGLEDSGVTGVRDLAMVTPGLTMTVAAGGNRPYMRGIGVEANIAGQETAIVTYLDGVLFQSSQSSILSFDNIERVEVLKGPQGTLSGRNSTGGVISIFTKDPELETSGKVKASVGNYDTVSTSFYGTTGITDNLAADISLRWADQGEGYGKNLANGKDVKLTEDDKFFRTKWKYYGELTDITFTALYNEFDSDQGWAQGVPKGSLAIGGATAPSDFFDLANDAQPFGEYENKMTSLKITHSFEQFDFMSLTAYQEDSMLSGADNDFAAIDISATRFDWQNQTYTQEFQLTSNNDDALQWVVGTFLLSSETDAKTYISGGGLTGMSVNMLGLFGEHKTTSWAVFSELKYALTDTQSLTLGLRYTDDNREFEGSSPLWFQAPGLANFARLGTSPDVADGGVGALGENSETNFDEFTWRLVYDVQITDDALLYASYNRGFRSGNYNVTAPSEGAFDPEIVDAYEIGLKSQWLDSMLQFNASIYRNEVEDLQLQSLEGTVAKTINAASATINGADFELIWAATDNLNLTLGAAYTDAEYDDFPLGQIITPTGVGGNFPATFGDVSGAPLINTPELTATLGATYTVFTDSGEYFVGGQASYSDAYTTQPDERLEVDNYVVVNLSAGWTSMDESWSVKLQGRNVFDEEYYFDIRGTSTGDYSNTAPPATYSLEVGYRF